MALPAGGLLVKVQVDLEGMDLGQEGHQVLQRPAEAIDGPGDNAGTLKVPRKCQPTLNTLSVRHLA
jgi:hypothetical protein